MSIAKEDIKDLDIVDSIELSSDGYYVFLTTTVVSTNSSKVITINLPSDGEGIKTGKDHLVNSLDRVYLLGTSGGLADGYYIINEVLSDTSFNVNENLADSTDGYAYFMYPVGAQQVGFDPTGLSNITSHNLQNAIYELSTNVSTIFDRHETLRQLIHFINEGPGSGFTSGAYKEILPNSDPFPTSIVWYTNSGKSNKIVEKIISYNSNKTPNSITWNMYDNTNNLIASIIDTITYNGVFEINRTRTIT